MLLLFLACSGGTSVGSDGPTLFEGVYAESQTQQWRPDGTNLATTLAIRIFTATRRCTPDEVYDSLSGFGVLTLWDTELGSELPPGSYSLAARAGAPEWLRAAGGYAWYAPGGAVGGSQAATSGTLTLSRVESAAVDGEVDLTLEDGTRIQGSFESRCAR